MRLTISHRTEYRYDTPPRYALQRLRLSPHSGATQTVVDWSLSIEGARREVSFRDHFGNETLLVSAEVDLHAISVEAAGVVETRDTSGLTGPHRGFAPLWLFLHETPLTAAGDGVAKLAAGIGGDGTLEQLHELMGAVAERVAYRIGATDTATAAEEALKNGSGVCQDHAHVFISAARRLGHPARYISGYLMMEESAEQTASHAWAEAHVEGLGWVGFDPANGISPDERYVRVATGRDYRDAMPISGIRLGHGEEELAVRVTVEQ